MGAERHPKTKPRGGQPARPCPGGFCLLRLLGSSDPGGEVKRTTSGLRLPRLITFGGVPEWGLGPAPLLPPIRGMYPISLSHMHMCMCMHICTDMYHMCILKLNY